jgi:hypothetical protein
MRAVVTEQGRLIPVLIYNTQNFERLLDIVCKVTMH